MFVRVLIGENCCSLFSLVKAVMIGLMLVPFTFGPISCMSFGFRLL